MSIYYVLVLAHETVRSSNRTHHKTKKKKKMSDDENYKEIEEISKENRLSDTADPNKRIISNGEQEIQYFDFQQFTSFLDSTNTALTGLSQIESGEFEDSDPNNDHRAHFESTLESSFGNMFFCIQFYFSYFNTLPTNVNYDDKPSIDGTDKPNLIENKNEPIDETDPISSFHKNLYTMSQEILDYLLSNQFISLLLVGINYDTNVQVTNFALQMFFYIFGYPFHHPIFDSDIITLETLLTFFAFVHDPTSCLNQEKLLMESKGESGGFMNFNLQSIFSSYTVAFPPGMINTIRQNALNCIAVTLDRYPQFIIVAQTEGHIEMILSLDSYTSSMIETVITIIRIAINKSEDPAFDFSLYILFLTSHFEIDKKPYKPAIEAFLSCIEQCGNKEQMADEFCTSPAAKQILQYIFEQDIELRKLVCWVITSIVRYSSNPEQKHSFISQIEWDKFFHVPADNEIIQLTLISGMYIITHSLELCNEILSSKIFLQTYYQYLSSGEYELKRTSFIQLSEIIDALPPELVRTYIEPSKIVDFISGYLDEDSLILLQSAISISFKLLSSFYDTDQFQPIAEELLDSTNLLEIADSYQDSDETDLAILCIQFLEFIDSIRPES